MQLVSCRRRNLCRSISRGIRTEMRTASCAGWLLAALMTSVHLRLLRADYTLQVMLTQYSNTDHTQGIMVSDRRCCREQSPDNCMEDCHNQFLFCLRPEGVTSGCPLGNLTTPIIPSDAIMFDDENSMYYMESPLEFNGTRWTGSAQLYVKVEDIEGPEMGSDLVTEFNLTIVTQPGSDFVDPGVITGTGANTFLSLQYRVLCVEDYFGPNCTRFCQETDSDQGHYVCDGSGNIVCMEGYSDPSTNCTIDLDPCTHTVPCLNGGTCNTTGPDQYLCECVDDFEGENCELNRTDKCDAEPCQNGATCVAELMDYTCQCVEGYEGKNCTINKDDCQSNPCLHGGSCTDQVADYNCSCAPGYEGKDCDEDIVDCHQDLCSNGGTCVEEVADYSCTCLSEYTGRNCEERVRSSSSDSGSGTDVGVIAGGVTTGLLLVLIVILVVVLVFVVRRKRKVVITRNLSKPASQPTPSFMETPQLTEVFPVDTGALPGKSAQTDTDNIYRKFQNPLYGSSVGEEEYDKLTSVSPPSSSLPPTTEEHYSPLGLPGRPLGGVVTREEDYSHLDTRTHSNQGQQLVGAAQGSKVMPSTTSTQMYNLLVHSSPSPPPSGLPPGRQKHQYQNIDSPSPPRQGFPPGRKKHQYQNIDSPPPPPIGPGSDWGKNSDTVEGEHDYDYAETTGDRRGAGVQPLSGATVEQYDTIDDRGVVGPQDNHESSVPPAHNYAVLEGYSQGQAAVHNYEYVESVGVQGGAVEPPHDYDYAEPKSSATLPKPPRNSWPYEVDTQYHQT